MRTQPEFQQGQRVRHRYEHWWGTVIQKLETPRENPDMFVARYVVTIDEGKTRDDIRPEDLTLS